MSEDQIKETLLNDCDDWDSVEVSVEKIVRRNKMTKYLVEGTVLNSFKYIVEADSFHNAAKYAYNIAEEKFDCSGYYNTNSITVLRGDED